MPIRKAAIAPRAGPHRRASDPGVKARRFPTGASRHRFRLMFRPPPTSDDAVVAWLVVVRVVKPDA